MKNVRVAFEFLDEDKVPLGHRKIPCHIIFDVKMMTLQRKAQLIACGHISDPPKANVYLSIILRNLLPLELLSKLLNLLDHGGRLVLSLEGL